uniref:DUF4371 domain-containing protein n=1 Tax=Esox lucius TaxID=8010 RepID=A0A6Q2YYZ8_ESOLU
MLHYRIQLKRPAHSSPAQPSQIQLSLGQSSNPPPSQVQQNSAQHSAAKHSAANHSQAQLSTAKPNSVQCSQAQTSAAKHSQLSPAQFKQWSDQYPWLFVKDNKLGCTACKEAKRLFTTQKGVQMAEEWISGGVGGSSIRAMRKMIYKHRDSLAHQKALCIEKQREKEVLPNMAATVTASLFEETANALRTAYFVAKERLAFTKMSCLVSLQETNGAKMGQLNRSEHACINMIEHVAVKMKKTVISKIKNNGSLLSITVDESSAFGISYLVIYIRADVTGRGDVENIFLDLVELDEGTTAENVYKALKNSLMMAKLDDEYLKNHLISIATDGAAVMTGKDSGLIARLKKDFPSLKSVHCLAHKLELAVHDSLKCVTGCNHFEHFISKLYTMYHQSTKNARLLSEAASAVHISLLKIGKIFTIRWVASSYSTVKAVWKDFPALAQQMRARKKYTGMLNRLTSTGFVTDLATMRDVLQELKSLSLKLQVSTYSSFVQCNMGSFYGGLTKLLGVCNNILCHNILQYKNAKIPLKESTEKVNQLQFFQAVIDNLSSLLPDSELTKLLKPLDPHIWPKTRDELILYGEDEIYELAKDLGEPAREAVEDFCSWKLQKDQSGKTLRRLIVASQTYLATSAECEQGFSAMNDTATVLFVDINAPPLEMFDPKPFVMSWLKEGHCPSTTRVRYP